MVRRNLLLLTALAAAATLGCGFGPVEPVVSSKPEGSPRPERAFTKQLGYEKTTEQDAIYAVLDQDKQTFMTGFTQLPSSAQPADFSAMFSKYVDTMTQVDLSAAPEPFRTAYQTYLKACSKLLVALKPLPGQYEGADFMNAMKDMYQGNFADSAFLGGDVINAMKELNKRYDEVYNVASNYGIDSQ